MATAPNDSKLPPAGRQRGQPGNSIPVNPTIPAPRKFPAAPPGRRPPIPTDDSGDLAPGPSPVGPSAADIEGLRRAHAALTYQIPEVASLLSNMTYINRQIGALLNSRSSLTDACQDVITRWTPDVPYTDPAVSGLTIDTKTADIMIERGCAGYIQEIEHIDRQIIELQERQAALFSTACRYIPSY